MRKTVAYVAIAGLLLAAQASPAVAGKKKHVHESFSVTALPFPNLQSSTGTELRSCFGGVEGVHWAAADFTAPGKGELRAYMEGFTGDWDLAVFLDDGTVLYSVNEQIPGGVPAEEEIVVPVAKGDAIRIGGCNYVGAPEAEVHYEGVFK